MGGLWGNHPSAREGLPTDIGFIERQSRRIQGLIASMQERPDPEGIKLQHPEATELIVTRPSGEKIRVVQLPAMLDGQRLQAELISPLTKSQYSTDHLLSRAEKVRTSQEAEAHLLVGAAIIFAASGVYSLQLRSMPSRSVQEPTTERAVFGPKDAFVESLEENIALMRGHLRDPLLIAHRMTIGRDAPTEVAVLYKEGAADPTQLDTLIDRLQNYNPPRVGFVSSLMRPIFGAIWSPFLPADFTERPYRAADFVFRGRFIVLADGSPWAMITPVLFMEYFIDESEYLQATATRYFVRTLRFLAFFLALLGPGLYVAVLTVNTTVMPGLLAIAVASNRQSLAYPILTETLLMLVVLDIMAEATTAMKGVLGPAISIVGSLIVGQAAVRANLASNLGVILLAMTALATFINPRYQVTYATRVLKYVFMLAAGLFGLMGWSACVIWMMINLSSQRDLGVSRLAPIAPLLPGAWNTASPLQRQESAVPVYIRRPQRQR